MQFDTEAWPLALLGLRILAVVLLYLFLLTAFRALRADLRAPALLDRRVAAPGEAIPATRERYPGEDLDEWDDDDRADGGWGQPWETEPERVVPAPSPRVRARFWVPVAAAVLVAAFGGSALLLAGGDPGAPPTSATSEAEGPADPFEPPTVAPDPGRVTVGLAATEDAQVRVTIDGVVEFDGTLPRGERQAWEGGERIQVWTDSGTTLQLAVNGVDLGAYSPAMGHPDWNRIDFGFWPGWSQ
ncbi:MAG: DUF4115 domain-containing protein [Dehalococcoidia bacterium]